MRVLKTWLIKCLALFFAIPLFAGEGQMAKANGIEIWYETFGQKDHPVLLLIMGGCCQGILWPTEFCERLANEGFYVIRYDHRDTGFSTCFDFESHPYNHLDMAKDAVGLLDFLGIEKAHLAGVSMGGPIAELMSVYYPEKVSTIALIATSCDFRPMNLACQGLPPEVGSLSSPGEDYLLAIKQIADMAPQNEKERLEQRLAIWRVHSGRDWPFEEERQREIQQEFLSRVRCPESLNNHVLAGRRSEELVRTVPYQVTVPTVVIHGSQDPLFPPDHGEALAAAIKGSRYVLLKGMGHIFSCHFYDHLIEEIKRNAHSN